MRMCSLKYRPEVDGLRAFAVVPVLLFHMGVPWVPGGYLGVDVFFVISGYLITSILLRENQAGTFTFKGFWARRVRRIMPALLGMVIGVLVACPLVMFLPGVPLVVRDAVSSIFSYANIHIFLEAGSYWGQNAEASPFLHAWSLSVEEQFYLLYPAFILLLYRLGVSIFAVLGSAVLASFCLFVYGAINHPTPTFYLLPTRGWELGVGGLVAWFLAKKDAASSAKLSALGAAVGLVAIVATYILPLAGEGISVLTIVPVLGAALVISYAGNTAPAARILAAEPVVFIGKVSYSLYLWHWPVIVLFKASPEGHGAYWWVWALCVITLLTLASYFWIEQPTRRISRIGPIVGAQLACALILCSILFFVFDRFVYESKFDEITFHGLYYDVRPSIEEPTGADLLKRQGIYAPSRPSSLSKAYAGDGIVGGAKKNGNPDIVVIGDSQGGMWAKSIDGIATELGASVAFYTAVGNNPFFDINNPKGARATNGFTAQERATFNSNVLAKVKQWRPRLVVIGTRWTSRERDWMNVEAFIAYCRSFGAAVLILEQPPEPPIGNNNSAQILAYMGVQPERDGEYYMKVKNWEDYRHSREVVRQLSAHLGCFLFPVSDYLLKKDSVLVSRGNQIFYYDDDHLSDQGTHFLRGQLKATLAEILVPSDGVLASRSENASLGRD